MTEFSGYEAKVLAHSVTQAGHELFTVEVTFPRFILAEFNTHRMFSRNSASSRAIPPEKHIERIVDHPFMPESFHARIKGMGQGDALSDFEQRQARHQWMKVRDAAVKSAKAMLEIGDEGVSKAHVNRLLEPFMWHTAIISATEWENFFALRCPPGDEVDYDFPAQPEFQKASILMRQAMRESSPITLRDGAWHLPLVNEDEIEEFRGNDDGDSFWIGLAKVASGRTAKVSFENHHRLEPADDSIDRCESKLEQAGHMSPLEHAARPMSSHEWDAVDAIKESLDLQRGAGLSEEAIERMKDEAEFCGNFRGYVQYRKLIDHEANRVGYLEGRQPWAEVEDARAV